MQTVTQSTSIIAAIDAAGQRATAEVFALSYNLAALALLINTVMQQPQTNYIKIPLLCAISAELTATSKAD